MIVAKVRNRVRRAPDSDVFALEVWLYKGAGALRSMRYCSIKRKWVGGC